MHRSHRWCIESGRARDPGGYTTDSRTDGSDLYLSIYVSIYDQDGPPVRRSRPRSEPCAIWCTYTRGEMGRRARDPSIVAASDREIKQSGAAMMLQSGRIQPSNHPFHPILLPLTRLHRESGNLDLSIHSWAAMIGDLPPPPRHGLHHTDAEWWDTEWGPNQWRTG